LLKEPPTRTVHKLGNWVYLLPVVTLFRWNCDGFRDQFQLKDAETKMG